MARITDYMGERMRLAELCAHLDREGLEVVVTNVFHEMHGGGLSQRIEMVAVPGPNYVGYRKGTYTTSVNSSHYTITAPDLLRSLDMPEGCKSEPTPPAEDAFGLDTAWEEVAEWFDC